MLPSGDAPRLASDAGAGLIRRVLREEVRESLRRERYRRRAGVGGGAGYRHGYSKPRKLSTPAGVVQGMAPAGAGARGRGL